ncbi:MAG: response regulator [bacterium]|nr:response regulator [bacterium]
MRKKTGIILLVEDDPGDQALTRRALEFGRIESELHVVEDGEEALAYLTRTGAYSDPALAPRPHLVLLDLNLPKLDGREVLRRMRELEDLRRIPVIALTTSTLDEDVACAYELGANSYIPKPVDMIEFIETLRELENYWFRIVTLPPPVAP